MSIATFSLSYNLESVSVIKVNIATFSLSYNLESVSVIKVSSHFLLSGLNIYTAKEYKHAYVNICPIIEYTQTD